MVHVKTQSFKSHVIQKKAKSCLVIMEIISEETAFVTVISVAVNTLFSHLTYRLFTLRSYSENKNVDVKIRHESKRISQVTQERLRCLNEYSRAPIRMKIRAMWGFQRGNVCQ